MMAIGHTTRSQPRWIRENVVITFHQPNSSASIGCRTCGGPVLTQRELADAVGVTLTQLTNFLWRRSLRPDVAAKIKASVLEVRYP